MPRTKLTRQQTDVPAPLFSPSFFPSPLFPSRGAASIARAADELMARANEMVRAAFTELPVMPTAEWLPPINVAESKDELTVIAELPGLTADDVTVDYTDGVLTISGEKTQERTKDERKYHLWERRFGSFQRALRLPNGIDEDKITAEFRNGVLTVHLPKTAEVQSKQHTIPITAAT
jgi:HSP20 family molecular chaperone IbpA